MRSGSYVSGRHKSRSQIRTHQTPHISSVFSSMMFHSRSKRTCSASPT